jgi:hypothetical protein
MANPFSNLLNDAFITVFNQAITALLEGAMVDCLAEYTPSFSDCSNCEYDPISKQSSGVYKEGGPNPFRFGKCPICNGAGRIPTKNTETLQLMPIWDYKKWFNYSALEARTLLSQGFVQTMSLIDTYDRIKNTKSVTLDVSLNSMKPTKFEREGEPSPIGMGANKFLITLWKSIG